MSEAERPVVVVTAIREELSPILRTLGDFVSERLGQVRIFRRRAGNAELLLAATGDGRANAAKVARALCEAYRPTALIGLGAAGALTPSLAPLDLVASAHLRNGTGPAPAPDPLLLALAQGHGAKAGTLWTVTAPLVTAEEKRALAGSLSEREPAAVDMESTAWAGAAAGAGVPFVVVRAIADVAAQELPDYLADCIGREGGIKRAAVFWRALVHPSSVSALLLMRRRVLQCGERLAAFLSDYFESS